MAEYLEAGLAKDAAAFHRTMAKQVEKNGGGYQIIAIKGNVQPIAQSALLRTGETINQYPGIDHGGGTVLRPSSHPPEWNSDAAAVFVAQKHASLQNTDGVLPQLFGSLTGNLGKRLGGERIGVDLPDLVSVGESLSVRVQAETGDPISACRR